MAYCETQGVTLDIGQWAQVPIHGENSDTTGVMMCNRAPLFPVGRVAAPQAALDGEELHEGREWALARADALASVLSD